MHWPSTNVMSTGSTASIVLSALMRARFCELLPPKIKHGETDLFLLGLLSLMDSILEIPMSEVLEKVPIDREAKAVLLGENSHLVPCISSCWRRNPGIGGTPRN